MRKRCRWQSLLGDGDTRGVHRVLTGLGRYCIEMREVSPMGALLSDEERVRVLRSVSRGGRAADRGRLRRNRLSLRHN